MKLYEITAPPKGHVFIKYINSRIAEKYGKVKVLDVEYPKSDSNILLCYLTIAVMNNEVEALELERELDDDTGPAYEQFLDDLPDSRTVSCFVEKVKNSLEKIIDPDSPQVEKLAKRSGTRFEVTFSVYLT